MKKNKKFLIAVVIFIAVLLIGNFIIDKLMQDKRNYYLQMQSKLLLTKYNTTYKYYKIMSEDIHTMYAQNHKLISLLEKIKTSTPEQKKEIRQKVYNLLKKNYKRLRHMGISQVHFHLPDNTSFLRMYAPNEYGDDLSQTRHTVVKVNKTHKKAEGFESCPYMVGLRFVYPIFDKNHEQLASVEISYAATELLKSVTDDFVYDSHILISKTIAKNTILESNYNVNYKETWESPEYLIEESTHKHLRDKNFYEKLKNNVNLQKEIAQHIKTQKPFSLEIKYNYKHIVLTFLPLSDVQKKKNIAYIVTYTQSDYLGNIDVEENYSKTLFFTITTLLFLFALYVMINRERLKKLALYDNLTQLPNRTLFMIELQNELNRALRYNYKTALMFIDLDGFKAVNDTYGHLVGDELLQKVAQILTSLVRKTDITARFAGDEFTIILPDIKDSSEAQQVAQKILDKLNKEIVINHQIIHIGASIGIAIYPENAKNIEDLIHHADKLMYEAKKKGKNKIICD